MRKSCGICGAPVQQAALEGVSAEYSPLKLTVHGMPVAKCTHGHKAPVEQEFMLWLIHELKDKENALAAGSEKGMLFKKYSCACGAPLADKSERRQAFPIDLAYENFPAFKVDLEMPVYKCTGCGKEQLRSHNAIRGVTSQAIARLNDAAGFPHAG